MSLDVTRRALLNLGLGFVAGEAVRARGMAALPSLTTELTGVEALRLMHSGDLKAEAYLSALLTRKDLATQAHALIAFDAEKALVQARQIDRSRMAGGRVGPLGGLPLVIKDNIDTASLPTSAGTALFKNYRPNQDAPVVQA